MPFEKKNGLNQFFLGSFLAKMELFFYTYIAACYKTSPIEVDHTYKNYLEFSVDFDSNQKKNLMKNFLIHLWQLIIVIVLGIIANNLHKVDSDWLDRLHPTLIINRLISVF